MLVRFLLISIQTVMRCNNDELLTKHLNLPGRLVRNIKLDFSLFQVEVDVMSILVCH